MIAPSGECPAGTIPRIGGEQGHQSRRFRTVRGEVISRFPRGLRESGKGTRSEGDSAAACQRLRSWLFVNPYVRPRRYKRMNSENLPRYSGDFSIWYEYSMKRKNINSHWPSLDTPRYFRA